MKRHRAAISASVFAGLFLLDFNSMAQPVDRIKSRIDKNRTIRLSGNRHPLARPEFEIGTAAPDLRMERMILVLQPDAAQQEALEKFLAAQHDPNAPEFHQWLTPETFARQFGVSAGDIQQVTDWLVGRGFTIEEVPAGGRTIVFNGDASHVAAAFRTSIRTYNVGGEIHYANATDPEIPEQRWREWSPAR